MPTEMKHSATAIDFASCWLEQFVDATFKSVNTVACYF